MYRNTEDNFFEQDSVERAKHTIVELTKDSSNINALDLFYTDNLEEVEKGIKQLNDYSNKCWLLSGIALYTLIYEKNMWEQSGLSWEEYSAQTRERVGLDPRDVTEQLSGARFFIKYRDRLLNAGWTPKVANRSLARAELAIELSGSVDETIEHLVSSSFNDFKNWYQSFKVLPEPEQEDKRPDIKIEKTGITIDGVPAVSISDKLPESDRIALQGYLEQIYKALKAGDVPAIVPVYDENEAKTLIRLRDKNRTRR